MKTRRTRPRFPRCPWPCAAGLLLVACGQGGQPFTPPLLLDRAGLTGRVPLAEQALPFALPQVGLLDGEAEYRGHVLGLAGDTRLALALESEGELALALYGPRRPDGLYGAARAATPQARTGDRELPTLSADAPGDYLVLVADPDRSGVAYRLEASCQAGCAAPRCPALVCGLYCPAGLAADAEGCPTCGCAEGCQADSGCPLGFVCREQSCQRVEPPDCECAEPYAPVCGQDGRTYANTCELACAGILEEHAGACEAPACAADVDCPAGMTCLAGQCAPSCDCSGEPDALVCGLDGLTYLNACELACAGVGLSHLGPCDTCNPEVCGDGQDNDCDGYADEGCGGTCLADSDCAAGQLCQAGLCASPLACSADADCPAGQGCEAGVCRVESGCQVEQCNGLDDDCDGLVDEGCPACRADADCAAGEVCELASGRCLPDCVPAVEECDGLDNDCDGEIDEGCAITCSTDGDCPAGQVCVSGQCVLPTTDADGDGFSPPEDCDDQDAAVNPAAAELCDGVDNDCDAAVDEDCPAPCATDADCDDSDPGTEDVCFEGTCLHYLICGSDSDCATGELCLGGVCVVFCRSDQECPTGWTCGPENYCVP